MPADRTISYPLNGVRDVADQLQDMVISMGRAEALELAQNLVIDVTREVDALRCSELRELGFADAADRIEAGTGDD